MAGTVPTITMGSITSMAGLEKRPVYFLTLHGGLAPNLVVKGDCGAPGADVSIKWGSKLMKHVSDDRVNTKLMTPDELRIFKMSAESTFAVDTNQREYLRGHYTWVKMPFVAGLSDADCLTLRTSQTKAVKEVVEKFLDKGVWYHLGKVVAADLFNGNNDRFQVLSGSGTPVGKWINKGNVMFLPDSTIDGATKVIGLDTFDPASDRSDLAARGHFRDLLILNDSGKQAEFAKACATGVGLGLKEAFRRWHVGVETFSVPARLPRVPLPVKVVVENLDKQFLGFAPYFEIGFKAGARELKLYLQDKARQYGRVFGSHRGGVQPVKTLPQGIRDRMAFLGW